jgi:hypothetical protein
MMRDFILRIFWKGLLRNVITKALDVDNKPIVHVTRDTLRLNRFTVRLQLEWRARDIHRWDRDSPPQRQAELFCEQTINDTDVAIFRLFEMLPEIEAIAVRVVEPEAAKCVILSGTVLREDLVRAELQSSPRMRLKLLGVCYRIVGGHLEPLDDAPAPDDETPFGARL